MTKQVCGANCPITLRRVLPIAVAFLLFALVLVGAASAGDSESISPTGTISPAIINNYSVVADWVTVYSEATICGTESMVVKLYDDNDELLGITTLVDTEKALLNGQSMGVTYHFFLKGTDNSWNTKWEVTPVANKVPTKVELWVDDVKVSENTVSMSNSNDNLGAATVTYNWGDLDGVMIAKDEDGKYYDTLQDAVDEAQSTITLLGDTKVNAVDGEPETHIWVQGGKDVVIDLNKNTVTGAFFINGKATIKNGYIVNTEEVSGIETQGDLTLENVEITSNRHALRVSGGTVTIIGGTYTSKAAAGTTCHGINISDGAQVTIKEGAEVNGYGAGGSGNCAVATRGDTTVLTIEDGVFKNENGAHVIGAWGGILNIEGGIFYTAGDTLNMGGADKGTSKTGISGGQFKDKPDTALLQVGKVAILSTESGFYEIVDAVAMVDSEPYANIDEAITAWTTNGGTLKLLKDCSTTTAYRLGDVEAVLDLNSYTLTSTVSKSTDALTLGTPTEGKATTLTIKDSSDKGIGCFKTDCRMSINAEDGTVVTLESGTLTSSKTSDARIIFTYGHFIMTGGTITAKDTSRSGLVQLASNSNTVATISGGVIELTGETSAAHPTVKLGTGSMLTISGDTKISTGTRAIHAEVSSNEYSAVEITGGTVVGDIYTNYANIKATAGDLSQASVTLYGSYDKAVIANSVGLTEDKVVSGNKKYLPTFVSGTDDKTYSLIINPATAGAKIGDTYYAYLSEAIDAAVNNDMIVLLKNGTGPIHLNKEVTIDLNGFILYGIVAEDGANIIVVDNGATKGKVVGQEYGAYKRPITIYPGAAVTISKDVHVINTNSGEIAIFIGEDSETSDKPALLNVYGTVETTKDGFAISGNGKDSIGGTVITIYDGATVTGGTAAIYHPQAGTLKIEGGTITGDVGIQMCSGTLNIQGNPTITATGKDTSYEKTGDGLIPDGSAISIVDRNYPGGAPSAKISGTPTVTATGGEGKAVNAYTWDSANKEQDQWDNAGEQISITGGTFATDVNEYTPDDLKSVQQADGMWGIVPAALVIWFDGDGNEVFREKFQANEVPVYNGEKIPTKTATETSSFKFTGDWTPAIEQVTEIKTYEYTAVFTEIQNPYTISWVNGDGTTTTTYVAPGELPTYTGATPTKAADKDGGKTYVFIGWDKEISPATGAETYTAQFKAIDSQISCFDYLLNAAIPVTINGGSDLVLPINFLNLPTENHKPTNWQINVTVTNSTGKDITSDIGAANITLTVKDGYGNNMGIGSDKGLGQFELMADAAGDTTGSVDDLFTITISKLPVGNNYNIDINIMTVVRTDVSEAETDGLVQYSSIRATANVNWLINKESNIYADGSDDPWDYDTNVWATLTVANPKVSDYTSSESVILAYRNDVGKKSGLDLTTSGTVKISKVAADGSESDAAEGTKIYNNNGMIAMKIAEGDMDAASFIIKFTGNKVGDVANVYGQPDTVNVIDVDYILHQATMKDANYIKDGRVVYGDVDKSGSLSSVDAVSVFKYSLNKATDADKKAVLLYQTV